MKWMMMALLLMVAACSKQPSEKIPSASVESPPAFTIAKESRDALQKAKDVSKVVEKTAEEQKKEIDEAVGNK